MPRRHRLSPLQRLVAIEIVLSGEAGASAVADVYQVSRSTVQGLVSGTPRPRRPWRKVGPSAAELALARQLYDRGASLGEISRQLGRARSAVTRWLTKM